MPRFDGFIGGAYQMDSLPIDTQRCINWYPEVPGNENSISMKVLRATPGYATWLDFTGLEGVDPGAFIRGSYRTSRGLGAIPNPEGSMVFVVGTAVYWVEEDKTTHHLGDISYQNATVSMVDDGFGLIIADGVGLYRLDLQTLEFKRVAYSLSSPTTVAFMGGYTIAIGTSEGIPSNSFFWSNNYDNNVWDALDYASAESSADPLTGILVNGSYLWLYGPSSYEVWSPTEDANLPFTRSFAAAGTIGLTAPKSVISVGNNICMIGATSQGSPVAYMSEGTSFRKISTIALEREWSNGIVSDCSTYAYSQSGHTFVVFNFDVLDKTYVYDITDGQGGEWHERATRNPIDDTFHRWAPNFVVQTAGTSIVGDRYSAKIFKMDENTLSEDGNAILRLRTTAHLHAAQKFMRIQSVTFDMETGNGISTQCPDPTKWYTAPTCMFRYSGDYGRTYSSEERQTFGAMGEYRSVLQFRRLGQARDFAVEFKISDMAKTSVMNGWVDVEEGNQRV